MSKRFTLELGYDFFLLKWHSRKCSYDYLIIAAGRYFLQGNFFFCWCGDQIQVLNTKLGKTVDSLVQVEDLLPFGAITLDSYIIGPGMVSFWITLKDNWTWFTFLLDGNVERTWKSLHLTNIVVLAFDPTTTLVSSGGTDGSLKVWDVYQETTHNLKGGSHQYWILHRISIEMFISGLRDWNHELHTSEKDTQALLCHWSHPKQSSSKYVFKFDFGWLWSPIPFYLE